MSERIAQYEKIPLNNDPKRLAYIDGLRGFAAIVVLMQHIMEGVLKHIVLPPVVSNIGYYSFAVFFNFGRFGVALFFLISGFVIPFSFRGKSPLRSFAISRFFRLYPAYWMSVIAALLVILITQENVPSVGTIVANFTMFQKYLGCKDLVGAYWTLSVELAFYILCAVLMYLDHLKNARRITVWIIVFCVISIFVSIMSFVKGKPLPMGLPFHLALMLVGTLIRMSYFEQDMDARALVVPTIALLLVIIPVTQFISAPEGGASAVFTTPLASVVAYIVALAMFLGVVVLRPSVNRFATWLGRISYSVYLFHGQVIAIFGFLLMPGDLASSLYFSLSVVVTVVIASDIVFRLVEKPMINIGKHVTRMILT